MLFSKYDISTRSGYYFILIAAALTALVHVLSKPILEINHSPFEINPIIMAFLIYLTSGLFYTPLARKSESRKYSRKLIFFVLLIGLAEVSALTTYLFGLKTSTAVNASIFSNSEIIFSLLISIIVFREKLHLRESIPFSLIIMGIVVIPITTDLIQNDMRLDSLISGDLLVIISGLFYALDIILCKLVEDHINARKLAQLVSFICAGLALSFAFILNIPLDVELIQLPSIVFIAIAGPGLSTIFFLTGLKLIGAARTVLLYSTTSVFGIVFAGLFLSESITIMNIVSVVMVTIGIFFLRNKIIEKEDTESLSSQSFVSLKNDGSKSSNDKQNTEYLLSAVKTKKYLVLEENTLFSLANDPG